MRKLLALVVCCVVLAGTQMALASDGGNSTQASPIPVTQTKPICNAKCHFKRDRAALRRKVPREPIPTYITMCESHGYLRAQNPSGAGGRYQVMPSTWEANLPRQRVVRLAGDDHGPTWSDRLLQDIVAGNVAESSGLGAWSCA